MPKCKNKCLIQTKKSKQLIKLLSKPRERVLCLLPGHPHPIFISCPLPGHTHLALLLLLLICTHSFTPAPWSYPSGLVAPTCSCSLIHSDPFSPTHLHLLIHTHLFAPTHSLPQPGHTCLALLLLLIHAHLFAPTWSSAGFCLSLLLGHNLYWFLLVPTTWSDLSGLCLCPFQLVCLYQIHS